MSTFRRLLQVLTPFADAGVVETPSFSFPLERVRTIRERAEDRAREALSAELRVRAEGEARLNLATEAVGAAREANRCTVGRSHVSATDLIAAQNFLERTERVRVEAALELDRRDAEVAVKRQHLAAAARVANRPTVGQARTSATDLIAAQNFLEHAERVRVEPALELDRRDAEDAVKRRHLAAAARDRQAIDKLEQRQRAEHEATWARRAQNTLDELALAVHRRGGPVAA
jgi:flagellar FliJ protein